MMQEFLNLTDFIAPQDQVMDQVVTAVFKVIVQLIKERRKFSFSLLHLFDNSCESPGCLCTGQPMQRGLSDGILSHDAIIHIHACNRQACRKPKSGGGGGG